MKKAMYLSQKRLKQLFISFELKQFFRFSIFILVFIIGSIGSIIGQSVGIGSTAISPDPSSILELRTSSKGLLIPRMTLANKNAISSPATGLLVYQTDGTAGFYYFNGVSWGYIGSGFSGNLAGDVTGTQSATLVNAVGGVSSSNVASGANLANAATNSNTASTIVKRDASGNFSIGTITGALAGNATSATNLIAGSMGSIPYQSASGTTSMLQAGTAGYVLQSNGNAPPSWVSPLSGSSTYYAGSGVAISSNTISIGQPVATNSFPTFTGINLTGLTPQGVVANSSSGTLYSSSGQGFMKMNNGGVYYDNSNYLTSSSAVTSFSGGTTGLTPNYGTGAVTLAGTLGVANGGTGISSNTPYGVITGGTSASGSLQNAGTGTIGQVLTSNGSSSLPTWQSSGANSGGLIKITYLKTAGAGVFTSDPSTTKIHVICLGGGGSGGGTPNDRYSTSGGGAAGSTVEVYLTNIATTYNYMVAASKAGNNNAAGSSGNNTTFARATGSGTTSLIAYGGGGGGYRSTGSTKIAISGGVGVLGTGGDINRAGTDGLTGIARDNGEYVLSGAGGSTPYGSGGSSIVYTGSSSSFSNGNPATGYGAGGGGAATNNISSSTMGGTGGQGLIIIYEYK